MKKKIGILVVGIFLLLGFGISIAYGKKETEAVLQENQRYAYAYLTSIKGNEITYMEVEESVVTAMEEAEKEKSEESKEKTDQEELVEMDREVTSDQRMNREERKAGEGRFPDQEKLQNQEMPMDEQMLMNGEVAFNREELTENPMFPKREEGSDEENAKSDSFFSERENLLEEGMESRMRETVGEIRTTYIPVGVTVHTVNDVSTTFSRLAEGDLLKLLLETKEEKEDVILEIWMLQ